MPLNIACPECGKQLHVLEKLAGHKIKCTHCGAAVTVPEAHNPASAPQRADVTEVVPLAPSRPHPVEPVVVPAKLRPAPPRPPVLVEPVAHHTGAPLAHGWRTVRTGLSAASWALLLCFMTVVVSVAVYFGTAAMDIGGAGRLVPAAVLAGIVGGGGALLFLAALLAQMGHGMCCAVPEETRVRGSAVGSLICLVNVPVAFALSLFLGEYLGGELGWKKPQLWYIVPESIVATSVVAYLNHALFLRFLRGVGRTLGNQRLLHSAFIYLVIVTILEIALVAGSVLAIVEDYGKDLSTKHYTEIYTNISKLGTGGDHTILPSVSWATDMVLLGMVLGGLAVVVILLFWFLDLLRRARNTITRVERARVG